LGHGNLQVDLDLRICLNVPRHVYSIITPLIEKLMFQIRQDKLKFLGLKVFLFGSDKSAVSGQARIVICGNDPACMREVQAMYTKMTRPMTFCAPNAAVFQAVLHFIRRNYAKENCMLVEMAKNTNVIRVYGAPDRRKEMELAIAKWLDKQVKSKEIAVSPASLRNIEKVLQMDGKQAEKNTFACTDVRNKKLVILVVSKWDIPAGVKQQ